MRTTTILPITIVRQGQGQGHTVQALPLGGILLLLLPLFLLGLGLGGRSGRL